VANSPDEQAQAVNQDVEPGQALEDGAQLASGRAVLSIQVITPESEQY
jgi:hypothetical protein